MNRFSIIVSILILAGLSSCRTLAKNRHHSSNEDLKKVGYVALGETHNSNSEFKDFECSHLYPFQDVMIDLEKNISLEIDGLSLDNFKTCSKFSHRFSNPISNPLYMNGKKFEIVNDKENQIYKLNFYENDLLVRSVNLPVEDPLPEVHEYSFYMLIYKGDIIMFMEDMYTTHYLVCKYNSNGDELLRKEIEHTYIAHPEPNTNHYNRYLYFNDITESQMVFTSHIAFADKFKTIVLSMDDFSITEYAKSANGLILDSEEENLIGFVTQKENRFFIQMVDDTEFEFELEYGNPACEFILKDSLLYIANYHPISTGSSLHCFDMRTNKMKWTADVKQVMADHSEYYNTVTLSMYGDKIIMEGVESYGNYVQLFNAESGESLAVFGSFFYIDE